MDFAKYTQHAGQFCCVKLRRNYALIEQKYPRNFNQNIQEIKETKYIFLQAWQDYQLTWNSSEFGGVDSVVINPRHLWIPDLLLYNR